MLLPVVCADYANKELLRDLPTTQASLQCSLSAYHAIMQRLYAGGQTCQLESRDARPGMQGHIFKICKNCPSDARHMLGTAAQPDDCWHRFDGKTAPDYTMKPEPAERVLREPKWCARWSKIRQQ